MRTRARAQDNQVFVLSANLIGDDGATRWCGQSAIVDPRGDILAKAGSAEPETIVAALDLTAIASEREREAALANRRPELYPGLRPPPRTHAPGVG